MLPPPSLPLQLTSVSWLIAGCSREHHFFNKCLNWNWLPSLLISSSCFFKISFYDLPPSHLLHSIPPAHDSDGPLTAPVGPNADPLAPWFRRNYAGINDGSPECISPLSLPSRQEEDPRLGNHSVGTLQGGESVLPKFTLEDKETWCFYFRVITKQQHSPIFSPCQANRIVAITCHRLKMFTPYLFFVFNFLNLFL